jgi:recombination protein RecT
VIGYAAYFSLINGFEKMHYLTIEEVVAHGKKFSKTFNNGPWKTDFDAMACKTVLKQLLDKYAPKSVEMQRAQIADQAVINDVETLDVDYIDNGRALPNYESMKLEIETNLIEREYSWQKGELDRVNEVLDTSEETSYSKVLELMNKRLITREEA